MTQNIEVELSELRQITSWLAAVDIEFIEISRPGTVVRLSMEREVDDEERVCTVPAAHGASRAQDAQDSRKQTTQVNASSVGVFLTTHPARSPVPLAAVGVHVRRGDVVGLLRIAELCVPVVAPVDGKVIRWLAPHAGHVGYGTPLLELAASSASPP